MLSYFFPAGYCCYSRGEFFWQTIERMETAEIICQTGLKACKVWEVSKNFSGCRYDKCVQVGMSLSSIQVKVQVQWSIPMGGIDARRPAKSGRCSSDPKFPSQMFLKYSFRKYNI